MAAGSAGKGGYDYDFVAPPDKSLECPVCLMTLRDPHMISCCGHEFCQRCIDRVHRDGKPCPLCNEPNFTTMLNRKLVREVNALVIRCPQKELGCEWEGELGQLQSHLHPTGPGAGVVSSKGCGFVVVECVYQCGAQLQRQLIQEHEMEICPKRSIEAQVACLQQKFEANLKIMTAENQQLRQELKEAHERELKWREELSEVKKKYELLQTAQKEQQKLHDELKVMHTKFEDHEKQCVSFESHTIPLPVPPFYFSLTNYDHYRSNNLLYHSESFYSHPGGYKMRIQVFPNGWASCRGTQMGVCVLLLRGEFDDKLHWPFDGSITIHLYNRTTQQWSNEKIIKMNEKECGLSKVDRCMDKLSHDSWGYLDFISLSELEKSYTKAVGILRFRVTNVHVKIL